MLSPCLSVKILKEAIIERRKWPSFINKDESAVQKQKMITLEVKFEPNVNGIIEEITGHRNVDVPLFQGF